MEFPGFSDVVKQNKVEKPKVQTEVKQQGV